MAPIKPPLAKTQQDSSAPAPAKPPAKNAKATVVASNAAAPATTEGWAPAVNPAPDAWVQKTSADLDRITGTKVTGGNVVTPYIDGENARPEIIKTIQQAVNTGDKPNALYYETYEFHPNDKSTQQIVKELIAAKQRGVDVKMVVDAVGASDQTMLGTPKVPFHNAAVQTLKDAGVDVQIFHPIAAAAELAGPTGYPRDHRKTIVDLDKQVAWMGGMNTGDDYMGDPSLSRYHDVFARVQGPAVSDVVQAFQSSFQKAGGTVPDYQRQVPPAAAQGGDQVRIVTHTPQADHKIQDAYLTLINDAQHTIRIENAFKMTQPVVDALVAARQRGVKVDYVVDWEDPKKLTTQEDPRSNFKALIDAGVRVAAYPHKVHTKAASFDGKISTLGSSNFDSYSLDSNREEIMVIENPEKAKVLDDMIQADSIADHKGNKSRRISTWDLDNPSDLNEWWSNRT